METMMKIKFLLLSLMMIFALSESNGQINSGVVKYEVEPVFNSDSNEMKSMFEKGETLYFNAEYIKTSKDMPGPIKEFTLFNLLKNEITVYLDFNGKKLSFNSPDMPVLKIEYTGKTKKIAGYECHEAIVKTDHGEAVVYYTVEIGINYSPHKGVKGFALEYTMPVMGQMGEGKLIFTATEIIPKDIKNDFFKINDEYKKVKMEDLQKEFGAGPPPENDKIKPGQPAPVFVKNDLEDKLINLSEFEGSVVVINFWFTGCKPCVMEIPELNEVVNNYKDKNVKFVAITFDANEVVTKFLKEHPFNYQIIPAAHDLIQSYGVAVFPTHVIIGKDGKIERSIIGGMNIREELSKTIDELLQTSE